jgi:hypothetical protein
VNGESEVSGLWMGYKNMSIFTDDAMNILMNGYEYLQGGKP